MAKEFDGKVVIVTGAASGLGRATALAFADQGATLAIGDVQEEKLQEVAELARAKGVKVTANKLDLIDTAACAKFVEDAAAAHGRLDALVNVAGTIVMNPIDKVTLADWDRVYAVNVRAPFFLMQAALPHLHKTEGGIVNIASNSAILGHSYLAPYSSSKAALVQLTKSMAIETIHSKVHINSIAPGGIATPMAGTMSFPQDIDVSLIARFTGLRGMNQPEDFSDMILFLASPRGKVAHGSCFVLDMGTTAG
ncbi:MULTISPECIES: SDR family NAD(P)-dependent oxidoreductase [Sphingomonas]|uniref:SDR family oxidoreductase n=2 Tax=Sphingomonas TaxID=13687 RepID=A0A5D9C7K1_9SPHN|nr:MULTISPECIES: SDR family oxidoreductase [Sphingomonas]TZG27669.1 SDR family oxidoreductase [Sphingomonas montanisoli]